ncbi:MAG: hypothetical protein OEZ68_10830 [Gammaproteobacteria bacterium]|nr:hypothetical protein [Gammaproteobacteria bacterium]MDH5801287.1 hypothetical protein [Gammaproteobacteria bacterium]
MRKRANSNTTVFPDRVCDWLRRPLWQRINILLGLALFTCAFVLSLLWNVPVISGVKGGDLAFSLFFMAGGILGLWAVSVKSSR